jgi:hypothetical protein
VLLTKFGVNARNVIRRRSSRRPLHHAQEGAERA